MFLLKALAYEDCNMIDINPESSISASESNSMLSKSATSLTTATDDGKACIDVTDHSNINADVNVATTSPKCIGEEVKKCDTDDSLAVCQMGTFKFGNCYFSEQFSMNFILQLNAGTATSISASDNDSNIPSISRESVELKQYCRSESDNSVQSWGSIISFDSKSEDEALEFMRRFVTILFEDSTSLSLELKSEFGEKSRVILIQTFDLQTIII